MGKVLFIRNFYLEPSLEYDESGHAKHSPRKGEWTTAKFLIEKVKSNDSSFELSGKRLALGYENKQDNVVFYNVGNLSLKVAMPSASITQAKIDQLADEIFVDLRKDPEEVPDYWRDLVSGNVASEIGKNGKRTYRLKDIPLRGSNSPEDSTQIASNTPQGTLYYVGGRVIPPKGLKMPDPEYPAMARNLRYEGTSIITVIVNEEGKVENPRIVRPLGFGLDESAVQAVKKWTFKPAMSDGKPVRVRVNVQVNYHMR